MSCREISRLSNRKIRKPNNNWSFNSEMEEYAMRDFCETYNLKNLMTEPTCYKNLMTEPTCYKNLMTEPTCYKNLMTEPTCYKNLMTEPTCYKNAHNPSLIDLLLTNKPKVSTVQCVLKLAYLTSIRTVCVLSVHFMNLCPTKIKYKNYKNFNLNSFKSELKTSLEIIEETEMTYDSFKETFINLLNKHAPMKEKFIRGNQVPFMNKTLSKAFMQRAKF